MLALPKLALARIEPASVVRGIAADQSIAHTLGIGHLFAVGSYQEQVVAGRNRLTQHGLVDHEVSAGIRACRQAIVAEPSL